MSEILKTNTALDRLDYNEQVAMHTLFFNEIQTRKDILSFEEYIINLPDSFDECPYPLFHTFADGMYTRQIHIPAGHIVTGAIHKNEYFVNVTKGRLWVVSEFGSKEIIAPESFVAKAGVKHIVYTLEDTVWSDTHKTDKTTIPEAEKDIFVDSYQEFDRIKGIIDYEAMCDDIGLTVEQAHDISRDESDMIECNGNCIEVKDSDIEGKGVFGTIDFNRGEMIALARVDLSRTSVGRYVNHSDYPNSKAVTFKNKGYFFALIDITKGAEITANYRDVRKQAKQLDRFISCQDM